MTTVIIDSDPQTLGPDASPEDMVRYRAALEEALEEAFPELEIVVELGGQGRIWAELDEDRHAIETWIRRHWLRVLESCAT